jgi:hypothetical protein
MNRIIIAATLVALALVLFGCAGTDNGNAASANPSQVNGNPSIAGNNSSIYSGADIANISQSDADPTAGLISNEDVPSPPS